MIELIIAAVWSVLLVWAVKQMITDSVSKALEKNDKSRGTEKHD